MDEAQGPPAEVWPDNLPAVNVFIAMGTQWRVGMSGPTGLDYSALQSVMEVVGVAKEDRCDVFNDLRALEDEALKIMHKK